MGGSAQSKWTRQTNRLAKRGSRAVHRPEVNIASLTSGELIIARGSLSTRGFFLSPLAVVTESLSVCSLLLLDTSPESAGARGAEALKSLHSTEATQFR